MIIVPSEVLVNVHGVQKIIKRSDLYAILLRMEIKRRGVLRRSCNEEITWLIDNLKDVEVLQIYKDGWIRLQYQYYQYYHEPRKARYIVAEDDFLSSILFILMREGKECILKAN